MNKIKVGITDQNGKTVELEGDMAYGCIMSRVERADGKLGVQCKSFLVGGGTIPVIHTAEPMAASIGLVLEQMAGGNKELELSCLEIADRHIVARGRAIMEGGGADAGAEH